MIDKWNKLILYTLVVSKTRVASFMKILTIFLWPLLLFFSQQCFGMWSGSDEFLTIENEPVKKITNAASFIIHSKSNCFKHSSNGYVHIWPSLCEEVQTTHEIYFLTFYDINGKLLTNEFYSNFSENLNQATQKSKLCALAELKLDPSTKKEALTAAIYLNPLKEKTIVFYDKNEDPIFWAKYKGGSSLQSRDIKYFSNFIIINKLLIIEDDTPNFCVLF